MSERAISVDVVRIPDQRPRRRFRTDAVDRDGQRSRRGNPRGARQDRGQRRGQRFHPRIRHGGACAKRLSPHLGLTPRAVEDKIAFVMSGGTEGVLSSASDSVRAHA